LSNAPQNALEIPIELRWSDQDLLGHVNNAKLMTIAEEARIRSLGALQEQAGYSGPLDVVLRTTHTDFLRPVQYESSIKVFVWVTRIGNTSCVMQHELVQHGQVCVEVEAVMVMVDSAQQAPTPIPDEVRDALETICAKPTE